MNILSVQPITQHKLTLVTLDKGLHAAGTMSLHSCCTYCHADSIIWHGKVTPKTGDLTPLPSRYCAVRLSSWFIIWRFNWFIVVTKKLWSFDVENINELLGDAKVDCSYCRKRSTTYVSCHPTTTKTQVRVNDKVTRLKCRLCIANANFWRNCLVNKLALVAC